ncbi:MAG TPA: cation:proton antiporter [Thermomicrobiales bacterium]|nr:cation:proton antiporter [Thermomicrobiales bacterium]
MLLGATVIAAIARKLRMPYAVALVLGGLAIEKTHVVAAPVLDPAVLLFAFLPPLLFDASFRIDEREVRAYARPIILLAVPGVLLTAAIVGVATSGLLGLPLAVGLLFGSIVAATDPVAVIAIVKQLALPRHLIVIPEAESLINDGMAITLYTAFLQFALGGSVTAVGAIWLLALEVVGGVGIGVASGFVFSRLTSLIDDPLLEMMLSTVLAYGSYLLADSIHASGALACVAAGFVHGAYGRRIGMSPRTSDRLDHMWEYLGFVANAILFLLVGFTVDITAFSRNLGPLAVAIVAVIVARVIVVELVGQATARTALTIPPRERIVFVWAGLRGALTVALALGLPAATPFRDVLIDMAFGVALVTLVGFGLTLPLLIRLLGIEPAPEKSATPHAVAAP